MSRMNFCVPFSIWLVSASKWPKSGLSAKTELTKRSGSVAVLASWYLLKPFSLNIFQYFA